jgi:hypothetical protein
MAALDFSPSSFLKHALSRSDVFRCGQKMKEIRKVTAT